MPINYSIGRGATDNRPVPVSASNFDDYRAKVEQMRKHIGIKPSDSKDALSHKKKRLPYLWGAMRDALAGRNAANAGGRDAMWLDMDGCSAQSWLCLSGVASMYYGFAYSTSSHEHPTANNEQRWRVCLALSRTVAPEEYKRLCEAVERELMDCYSLIGDGPIKWDRSVYNLDHMVYGPHESAIFIDLPGNVVDVDMMLATAHDVAEPLASKKNADADDFEHLVALDAIDDNTFTDLRSAMWHPAVLADAEPDCGKYLLWAAMGNRLAWFIDTEFEDQARSLWVDWSIAGGGDGIEAGRKWDAGELTADRTGYQAIFARASKVEWVNPGADRLRASSVASVDDFDELPPEEPEKPRSFPHAGGYGKPGKFIVEGLISVGVNMIYGPSSSFKSYLVLSLLCRIAMKMHRWAGRNLKGGAVLYIAAEGGSSVMPRVGAWADKYNDGKPVELFYTLPLAVDLSVPARVDAIIKEIKRIELATDEPVRAVAVDTLSQSMMQGDENSASDIAKFMAGATRIVNETGAAVLPVHHSGKDSSKGMRGSSAAFANADTVIRVERIGDAVNLVNEKQRTGPAQPTQGYLVPTVPLPDSVIAENEALDDEYTSTEGEVYAPVKLTTERVFEDVPLAEISAVFDDDAENDIPKKKRSSRGESNLDWVLSQIDDAGGEIAQKDLRNLWNVADKPYSGFGSVMKRLAEKGFIEVTKEGNVRHAPIEEVNNHAEL